jgi:hypothetical protein
MWPRIASAAAATVLIAVLVYLGVSSGRTERREETRQPGGQPVARLNEETARDERAVREIEAAQQHAGREEISRREEDARGEKAPGLETPSAGDKHVAEEASQASPPESGGVEKVRSVEGQEAQKAHLAVPLVIAAVFGKVEVQEGNLWRELGCANASEKSPFMWEKGGAIRVSGDGARFDLNKTIQVCAKEGTELHLESLVPLTLGLKEGHVFCNTGEVGKKDAGKGAPGTQAAGEPVVVVCTQDAEVRASEARFGVVCNLDSTLVIVADGDVTCSNSSGEAKKVEAGTGVLLNRTKAPGTPEAMKLDEHFAWLNKLENLFDFEDGRRPCIFDAGQVQQGPERRGSRFCLVAEPFSSQGRSFVGVQLQKQDENGLFVVRKGTKLEFKYWAGTGVREIWIDICSVRQVEVERDKAGTLETLRGQQEKWITAKLPARQGQWRNAQSVIDSSQWAVNEGDCIKVVRIYIGGESRGQWMYVDDLRIVEPEGFRK